MDAAIRTGPDHERRLSWSDPAIRWLLLLTLVLALASWWMQRGYPLADAVEFMDRAKSWVAGEPLGDARTVRSFAFSSVFVPPFLLARAIGLDDPRPILVLARMFEVTLTLGLVLACARLGQKVAGRSAGLAVGWVVAINPVVLQFSVHPVSGIAAALCIAMGLERLIVRGDRRDGWIGGLWFGLAFLMAYQSLLVAAAVFVVLVARDRWSARSSWLGLIGGLLCCAAIQLVLDRVVYGQWQGSLWRYLIENVGNVMVHVLSDLGFSKAMRDLYTQVAQFRGEYQVNDPTVVKAAMRFGAFWYVISAPRVFVWPLLALLLIGAARALSRPRWTSSMGVLALIAVMLVMAMKGDKSLRLCLPLIPLCVPLFAVGWAWLAERGSLRWIARAALVAALPLAFTALSTARPRAYAAYWDAADWINAQAASLPVGAHARVASAYDWAVFLRFSPRVTKVKLSDTLDRWKSCTDSDRQAIAASIDALDWLIVHEPLLKTQPTLLEYLAPRFEVAAAFYDQDEGPELGAVLVLRRSDHGGARLFEYHDRTPSPATARKIDFKLDSNTEPLSFLGYDFARLPGSGWWWITYHWQLPTSDAALEVRDRISAPDEKHTWQNDHALGRGSRATTSDARFLSEGFLFVPSDVELANAPHFSPLGGPFRRGDLIPVRLWVEVRALENDAKFDCYRASQTLPVRGEFESEAWRWSVDGYRFSKDGLVQVGGFFLPVHPRAYVRDNGKPIPD